MDSSDDDGIVAQTTIVKKEKKPRTEAQRQATAKALEALAKARQQKREEQKRAKSAPLTQSGLHRTKAKVATEEYPQEQELPPPPPPRRMTTIPESTPTDNMRSVMDELANLRNELKGLRTPPEPKAKPRKSQTTYGKPRARVVVEEESEEEEEEPVIVRRKKKNTNGSKTHTPMEQRNQVQPRETDTNALLQSIFFRNY